MRLQYDLGEGNLYAKMCLSRLRFVTCLLKDELRKNGLWDDLIQELYVTAFEAWQQKLGEMDTYRYTGRRIYAFLKSCGYRLYRGAYVKLEKPFAVVFQDIENVDEFLQPLDSPARPYFASTNLGERILQLLRYKTEGMKKWEISNHLQISVQELEWHLAPLIKSQQIIEIKRENFRGRPQSPLLVIDGAPIPELKKTKTEMMERIRHAYFVERKSIKGIAREYHHDKRIVRRAIRSSPAPAVSGQEKELVSA